MTIFTEDYIKAVFNGDITQDERDVLSFLYNADCMEGGRELIELSQVEIKENYQSLLSFIKDIHGDYKKGFSREGHWLDNHDVHKIIYDLFPERYHAEVSVHMIVDLLSCLLIKEADYHVLQYKFTAERKHRDFMLLFAQIDIYTREMVLEEDNRKMIVYFAQCEETGRIKIGKTICGIEQRMAHLRTASSTRLQLIGCEADKNDGALESIIHDSFKGNRLHGEWFEATPGLMKYIKDNTTLI